MKTSPAITFFLPTVNTTLSKTHTGQYLSEINRNSSNQQIIFSFYFKEIRATYNKVRLKIKPAIHIEISTIYEF